MDGRGVVALLLSPGGWLVGAAEGGRWVAWETNVRLSRLFDEHDINITTIVDIFPALSVVECEVLTTNDDVVGSWVSQKLPRVQRGGGKSKSKVAHSANSFASSSPTKSLKFSIFILMLLLTSIKHYPRYTS